MIQRHIIHKQKVTLYVNKQEEAHGLQNLVSRLMQNELSDKMESVFAELFPSDKIIRMDSLHINLANINPANFEEEFKNGFIAEFRKVLSSKKENLSEANNEEELSNARSLVLSLIFFLENGSLPWYRSAKNIADWEEEITQNLSTGEYEYLLEWLRHSYYKSTIVLQRLAMQFSDMFLEKLILKILPGQSISWEDIYTDLDAVLNVCLNEKKSHRVDIWKYAFHVLLNNSELDDADKANVWAFQVLKLLADRFDISGISSLMEIKLNKKLKTNSIKDAFKELVAFLDTRGQSHNNIEIKNKKSRKKRSDQIKDADNNINKDAAEQLKSKQNILPEGDAIYVTGSGAVILHFFLNPFFEDLKLVANGKFVDTEANQRAVLLLHYLVTGETETAEFNLALQKILCGYPLPETLPSSIILTKKEKTESIKLLTAVTDYWVPLKNTSIDGLRSGFLQREGKLNPKENGWLLTVEQKTLDILLSKIPWGFSTIRLPWMGQILNVDWY